VLHLLLILGIVNLVALCLLWSELHKLHESQHRLVEHFSDVLTEIHERQQFERSEEDETKRPVLAH